TTLCTPVCVDAGVHAIAPPAAIVIPAGAVVSRNVSASPSGSVAVTAYAYASPSVADVMGCDVIVGARFGAATVTLADAVACPPRPSDTVSVAVNDPGAAYACCGVASVEVAPSPKVHANDSGSPSASDDPALVNEIGAPVSPVYGPPALAIGG